MINYVFERFEKKYLITQDKLDKLVPFLLSHMNYDEYCKEGRKYSIYNIYFDTTNDDIIRSCILYPKYKEKMRIRSYKLLSNESDYIFLEIKKKYNGKGSKRRVKLSFKEAEKFINETIIPSKTSYFDKQILKEFNYYLTINKLKPIVFLSYDRLALIGEDNLRITIDSNLKTRRDNVNLYQNDGNHLLDCNQFIMEIKISTSIPLWLSTKLSELQIYSQGFSKYGYDYHITNKQIKERTNG